MQVLSLCLLYYDSGINDDTLTLLYEANQNVKVRVKTPCGLTVENTLNEIVLQGDTWGPPMAANQVDSFGKEMIIEEPSFMYKYMGVVAVPLLGQVDDLIGVAEAGHTTRQLNSFVNVKTADKNLQFWPEKGKTKVVSKRNVLVFTRHN